MSRLRIARGFALSVDVAGEAIAILAKRGAGKTNTARVLVEELHGAGVQVVVLDPVGAWWGLRSSADGKSAGLPLPVLGGAHGDVPLQATAGALLADVVVDTAQSIVLDLSDFSKTEQRRFVTDFAERLYTRKARERGLLHLVLEEADEFAPQRVNAGDARMVGAIEQLVRRGRSRGIGLTMITQRSASLNKSILTQADVLFAMRTTGPQDRKAIETWVEKQDVDGADDVVPSLSSLATGEAWIWNPERELLQRIKIRLAHTYDSSSTPKAGERRVEPRQLAPIDLTALGAEIEATAERAKDNDPAELRKRIRRLEEELKVARADVTKDYGDEEELRGRVAELERELAAREPERVEVPVLSDGQIRGLERSVEEICRVANSLAGAADSIAGALEAAKAAPASAGGTEEARRRQSPRQRPQVEAVGRSPARPPALAGGADDARVSRPQQKILDALAWFEAVGVRAPRRSILAPMADTSSKSSGFEKNLSTLRTGGSIEYGPGSTVYLTPEGRELAAHVDAPGSAADVQDAVIARVSRPQGEILRVLIGIYPAAITREELADRAGTSASSSGFEKNLSTLRTFGVIGYPTRGEVVALPILFLEAAA